MMVMLVIMLLMLLSFVHCVSLVMLIQRIPTKSQSCCLSSLCFHVMSLSMLRIHFLFMFFVLLQKEKKRPVICQKLLINRLRRRPHKILDLINQRVFPLGSCDHSYTPNGKSLTQGLVSCCEDTLFPLENRKCIKTI